MIEIMEEKDLRGCVEVFFGVFTDEPWNYTWMNKNKVIKYFFDMFDTPNFVGYVYRINNKLAGACFGVVNDYFLSSTYDVKELFVSAEFQGTGVGSALMDFVELDLKKFEVSAVTLFTQQDIEAYSFYIKNGFVDSKKVVHMSKAING